MSLWADRLAEVWSPPGRAGAGVVVGERGVLTARHVVEAASAGAGDRPLARVVRPGVAVGEWVPMTIQWDDADWDVALLSVDPTARERQQWLIPTSGSVVIVAPGDGAQPACEAVGFPQSEVVEDASAGGLRQSEQAVGILLPSGQGKPPVRPGRPVAPGRWLPLDVETATPGLQRGWGGMSGAAVVLPDGRLVGLILTAESGHQQRRLYVVPLAALFEAAEGFADALAGQTGRRELARAYSAPVWERLLSAACVGEDGLPATIAALDDLGAFGVKATKVADEPPYLDYVARDDDEILRAALDRAVADRRMLLVVGGSAAGKSRSTAEALARRLPGHRLLRVQAGRLAELLEAPLAEVAPAVIWLEDLQLHAHQAFPDTLKRLLGREVAVVGLIRRAALEVLTAPGDLHDPTGDALSDEALVERVDWRTTWSSDELGRLGEHVRSPALLAAAASGTPPGAYAVAGPALVKRLSSARSDEDHPVRYWLVRTVLDWHRTGMTGPMPSDDAVRFAGLRSYPTGSAAEDELDDALAYALRAEFTVPRSSRAPSLLMRELEGDGLTAHDYVLDDDQHHGPTDIPDVIWDCATAHASKDDLAAIGSAAYLAHRDDQAASALVPLAEAGDAWAMRNLGVLFRDSDPAAARDWYERAADAGHPGAMNDLGVLLADSEPAASRDWYERAAEAGDGNAMGNLGLLLEDGDPAAARGWYERGAKAGHAGAMFRLGVLLEDSDPAAARGWFECAAEAGDAGAMFRLGELLEDSDPDAALRWYFGAGDDGYPGVEFRLGVLLQDSDPERARGWYEVAAEDGDADAMFNLGVLLEVDDPAAARDWYERAADAGEADAMFNLGVLLEDSDPAAARDWYERAAEAGDADAMNSLGLLPEDSDPAAGPD